MSWGETLFLKKVIDSKKSIVASDKVFKVLSTQNMSAGGETIKEYLSFKLNAQGSFKIKCSAIGQRSSSVRIYKNGSYHIGIDYSSGVSETLLSGTIVGDKGDVFTIEIRAPFSNSSITIYEASLCAELVDNSIISIL